MFKYFFLVAIIYFASPLRAQTISLEPLTMEPADCSSLSKPETYASGPAASY
jgi:hypothetical protein